MILCALLADLYESILPLVKTQVESQIKGENPYLNTHILVCLLTHV